MSVNIQNLAAMLSQRNVSTLPYYLKDHNRLNTRADFNKILRPTLVVNIMIEFCYESVYLVPFLTEESNLIRILTTNDTNLKTWCLANTCTYLYWFKSKIKSHSESFLFLRKNYSIFFKIQSFFSVLVINVFMNLVKQPGFNIAF